MAQGSVYLIGGGWNEAGFAHTYGPFAEAVGGGRIAVVLLDEDDRDAYFARNVIAFAAIGVSDVYPVFVSPERPLQEGDVAGAGGILVGGGLTPAYHEAIVPAAGSWLRQRVEDGLPYAGFSAGAMIAATDAIVGGWKLRRGDTDLAICSEDVSEDEEYLDVRQGLGLVPFAVDVHAAQYGTPTRLLHAVRSGRVVEGWAIDEDTMVAFANGDVSVYGLGGAYHVRRDGESLAVTFLAHGDRRQVG